MSYLSGNATVEAAFSPTVDASEILFDVVFMSIVGFLGTVFGVAGFFVVRKNSILTGLVEHYVFVDLINLTTINACHLLWGVPCALWNLDEAFPTLNYVFGGFAFTAISMGFPPKFLLGLNRFCALSFDGRFYKHFEETKILQYIFLIGYPLLTAIAYSIPGCHSVFVPDGNNYFFVETDYGPCGWEVMYCTQVIASYFFLPASTFLDGATFFLMRKRIRSFNLQQTQQSRHKGEKLKKELKLSAQMLINLFTGLLVTLSILITVSESNLGSTFVTFLMITALWQTCTLVSSVSYVILLHEKKTKGRRLTVSTSAIIMLK